MSESSVVTEFFPLLLVGAVLYFVALRPQQKRQQQIRAMLASLAVDQDVITIGGLYGTIADLDDEAVDLRVSADGLVLRFQKGAIAKVVVDTDLDSADVDSELSASEAVEDRPS